MNRRTFLTAAAGLALRRRPRILLRSSWQTVNIGDIAHTPGALALLERHVGDADVTLWASPLDEPVRSLLRRRFPRVSVIEQAADAPLNGSAAAAALAETDLLLHGSGASIVAAGALRAAKAAGRAYAVYGVTLDTLDADLRDLVAGARFFLCRDTDSLAYLRSLNLACPVQEFVPDATFGLDIRDDRLAAAFLRRHGLQRDRFVCVVPRLRWTPYPARVALAAKGDPVWSARLADNDRYAEQDHAKLREAIVAVVRATTQRVLLCPEMTYQVPLLRPLLFDPLPADVKASVVVRDSYWNTDEAASTYAQATAVVSCEMHSPIIAVVNGTPAIHVRQPTDTRKGQMWRDIGLDEWLFEIDQASGSAIAGRLLEIIARPGRARASVARAMGRVHDIQRRSMQLVGRVARRSFDGAISSPVGTPPWTRRPAMRGA